MAIAMAHSDAYAKERFSQLDSQRMVYLFQRNVQELSAIVQELWQELSVSEFIPADFELSFGDGQKMNAIDIPDAQIEAQLRGFVDRVDVWNNGYTNYFRVVDYKTGRKDFDYCDVFNGVGLQMLLYLFTLSEKGSEYFGREVVPAGVLYLPARDVIVKAERNISPEKLSDIMHKELRRSGMVLSQPHVLQAMEHSALESPC